LEIFQFNYNKNPNQFITLTGMARGLFANREDDGEKWQGDGAALTFLCAT
jgi:hypothetical protein